MIFKKERALGEKSIGIEEYILSLSRRVNSFTKLNKIMIALNKRMFLYICILLELFAR